MNDKVIQGSRAVWHVIHDFLYGWGVKEHIPDNFVVTEDHTQDNPEYSIPWKVGHNIQEERFIYMRDVNRLLKVDLFQSDPDAIYDQIKPLLEQEHAERKAYDEANPIKFDKFTIPNIKNVFPPL